MTDVAIPEDAAGAVTLFGTDNPAEALEGMTVVARMLRDVCLKQNLIVKIGQSEHPRVEAWTFCGSLLGVFPIVVWTHPVLEGEQKVGWEARAEARTRAGEIVGAGEAQCLRGERTWKGRDDFALRAMAQTRAVSRAMRGPLGFVMQLAGFNPTPAEEMPAPGSVQHPEGEPVDDGKFPPDIDMPPSAVITDAQRRRLRAIQKEAGMRDDELKVLVAQIAGVDSSKLIPAVRYDALIAAVQRFEAPTGEGFQVPESLR